MTPEGRLSDRAFVLTVTTLILLTPPIVVIFDVPVLILGIPLLHVYCFAVWLAAIVAGGVLATRMSAARSGFLPSDGVPDQRDEGD
jgi:hypothetical protein